jgi:hypothetical protein
LPFAILINTLKSTSGEVISLEGDRGTRGANPGLKLTATNEKISIHSEKQQGSQAKGLNDRRKQDNEENEIEVGR